MTNKKRVLFFLLFLIPVFSIFSFDPGYLNKVTFINKTGTEIWFVFLSPGDSGDWGFDILGSERILNDNSLLSFYISFSESENYYDVMAIDTEGHAFILFDELFSDEGMINLIIDEGDLDNEYPEISFLEVQFENQTEYEMLYLFVSPLDSALLGVDILDDEQTILPNETIGLLAPFDEDTVSYNVLAVDENGGEYAFTLNVHSDYTNSDDVIWIPIEYSDLVE